jgi:hypothetical protein
MVTVHTCELRLRREWWNTSNIEPSGDHRLVDVSSRAWSTIDNRRYGASRKFERVANIQTASGWASHLAWSKWTPAEGGGCEREHDHLGYGADGR